MGGTITFTGPDDYGYYAYSDQDETTGRAPTYSWTEISSIGTRLEAITNTDDGIATYSLPFTFKYYGTDYTQVSVCTNGFVALGVETWSGGGTLGHERPIPTEGQAAGFVAGFWDDLNPRYGSGEIYSYNNTTDHQFIIEFKSIIHYGSSTAETFQFVFCDPDYYSTITDDGEIIVQYQTVGTTTSNAVGIESPDETDGIQYLYHDAYDDNAEDLDEERAIKFTTNPPTVVTPWVLVSDVRISEVYPDGNGNYFAEDGERVSLYITLTNQGTLTGYNVTATLSETDAAITMVDNSSTYGTMSVLAERENTADPYTFDISGLSSDRNIDFQVAITANSGAYTRTTVVTVPVYIDLGVNDRETLPNRNVISEVMPNPFNSTTQVLINTPEPGLCTVQVTDLNGKQIMTIKKELAAGKGSIDLSFDEQNSGVYLYRVITPSGTTEGKMIYIK